MREMKITNYTTRDWLKKFGSFLCAVLLGQWTFLAFKEGDWYYGIMLCLGAVGWILVHIHINKSIEKKNPQEEIK